jgi:predicted lipoprotein with Yx(FWY)xxD motif
VIRSHTRLETRNHAKMLLALLALGVAAMVLAACSSSGTSSVGSSGGASRSSPAAAAVAALVVLGVSVAMAGSPAPAAGDSLKTATIGGVTVLTNARGFTLYWFTPDTATTSNCTGGCVAYWPPVTGTPAAGPGVTGKLGTITRPGGATQVTYDGHPLYTYVGDARPRQANGNNLNLNAGLRHEVTITR